MANSNNIKYTRCKVSARGLFELPPDITLATEVLGRVTGQIVAVDDSKLQEFAEIFNYFVNLTQLENEGREEVNRLTASSSTKDDDDDDSWQAAINDAWAEENITTEFNETLADEVVEYIEAFVSKPENLKVTYLHNLSISRREDEAESSDSEEEEETNFNPFWDVTLTRRIYAGKRTKMKLYPFVASVLMFNMFACAGAIIKSDLVITAASCLQLVHNNRFFRENPAFLSVRVGSIYFSIGGEVVPVTEVYFHPSYEPLTLINNLAIMRLRRVLNFKYRKVKKIDFDRHAAALPVNTPGITIVGWGAKTESNKLTAQIRLHTAELDYYDFDSCRDIYGKKTGGLIKVAKNDLFQTSFRSRYRYLELEKIYRYLFNDGHSFVSVKLTKAFNWNALRVIKRDVGDPGVAGRFLVGVTSFGSPLCGKVDTPTVFTKLGYYTDWIEEIMALEVPRMSKSTTTQAPFYLINSPIQLYGISDELKPIPLLRELQDVKNEPVHEERAIQEHAVLRDEATQEVDPAIEADPEITYDKPDKESLRIQPPTIIETGNVLVDYNNIQSDEDSEDEAPTEPVQRTTAIVDFEPTQHDTDTDIESVARTMKSAEMNYKLDAASMLDLSDIDDSTKRPVTGMINDDVEETISNFSPEMEVNTVDDDYATTSMNENQDVWVDLENYTAAENFATTSLDEDQDMLVDKENRTLRKKHHTPSVDSQVEVIKPNKTDNQIEQNNNIDENGQSAELGEIKKKIVDISSNILDHGPPENAEVIEPEQSKFQEEIADDMVKREIQKLITQLEISSEISPNVTNYTPLRHLANNEAVDEAKTSDSVLTFLYLTDNEKQVNPRASADTVEEGLSIDPAPFQGNMHMRSELLGKSEIYEILAKVMDTVVNKTTG